MEFLFNSFIPSAVFLSHKRVLNMHNRILSLFHKCIYISHIYIVIAFDILKYELLFLSRFIISKFTSHGICFLVYLLNTSLGKGSLFYKQREIFGSSLSQRPSLSKTYSSVLWLMPAIPAP